MQNSFSAKQLIKILTVYVSLFLFTIIGAYSQTNLGQPPIKIFSPNDFNASSGNFWVEEGPDGLMFFANGLGVLIFDGVNWKLVKTKFNQGVVSLAYYNNTMYVATNNDIGYLDIDEKGEYYYVSLNDLIPEEYKDMSRVWDCHIVDGEVTFWTTQRIYTYDGESIAVKELENEFHVTNKVHGRQYARLWGKGLCVYENGDFKLVPDGEKFANERVYTILPYGKDEMLIGVRNLGFFIYDGEKFTAFKTEIDALVAKTIYFPGVALENGNFLINTLNGAYIIDPDGKLLQKFTNETGLNDDRIDFSFLDSRNNVWLLSDSDIIMIDLDSPFRFIDANDGLTETIIQIEKFQNTIYLGTQNGIFYIDKNSGKVKKLEGISGQVFGLESVAGNLLASSNEMGLLNIKDKSYSYIRANNNYDFRPSGMGISEIDSSLVYVYNSGKDLHAFRYKEKAGEFIEGDTLKINNSGKTLFFETENDKFLYEITKDNRISYFDIQYEDGEIDFSKIQFKYLDSSNGVPENILGSIAYKDSLFLYDETFNFYSYNPESNDFTQTKPFFSDYLDSSKERLTFKKDSTGKIFFDVGTGLKIAKLKPDGGYDIDTKTFSSLNNFQIGDFFIEDASKDGSQIVWISTLDGLIRYQGNFETTTKKNLDLYIMEISVSKDSLIFGGAGKLPTDIELPYANNALNIEYAAPVFSNQDGVEYATYLEGFDSDWSEFSKRTSREFLNLPSGNYTFKAKARSVSGTVTDEITLSFNVITPWYKTWWAYSLYALGLILLVYAIIRQRTGMLKARQVELEKNVEARTAEVQKRLGELATVNTVSMGLTEKLQLSELIQMVGDEMKRLFNSDITYLALADRENNIINFPYQDGDTIAPQKFGNGLTSKIITTGEALLINKHKDIDAEYDKIGIAHTGKPAISYLGVPIRSEDTVVGVLSVQSTEHESRFNEEDKRLLNTIAINVGVALHNAELFEEAKLAKAKAEDANEAKSAFLSTVSHELRTPLTSVLGFAKIIRKRLEDKIFPAVKVEDQKIKRTMKQVSENLNVVISEGERLTTLINDVLDLAKIESGKMDWNKKPLFLQDAINRAIASTQSLIDSKSLKLEKKIAPDLPMVHGDEDKLIQVVINLLSNAIKFTDKGKVRIEAYKDKDQIIVEIQDTGIGIAEEDKNKVFEKFRQAGDTLTNKPKGTGLGLPICREIIEHHEGIIWMNSEPGVGSTFFFSLPGINVETAQQPLQLNRILKSLKKQITHSARNLDADKKPTILVVDDDTPIRSLLRQELGDAGYRIREAADGKAALEMVRHSKPDLIILDVMMPEINGFDVAAAIKNDPATMDIPIIILSIVQDKERGLKIGVDRYLTKPINTEELFHEVDVLLEQGVSKKKVLVVDDDSTAVKSLTDVLSARGYKVMEAKSSGMMESASENQPDIIMLNSVHNGDQELIKKLKKQHGMENVMFFIYE